MRVCVRARALYFADEHYPGNVKYNLFYYEIKLCVKKKKQHLPLKYVYRIHSRERGVLYGPIKTPFENISIFLFKKSKATIARIPFDSSESNPVRARKSYSFASGRDVSSGIVFNTYIVTRAVIISRQRSVIR